MPGRRRSAEAGFTIMEAIMASTVLLVGFIGTIQSITIGSQMIDTARNQTVAQQLIDYEIEQLRASPWNTIAGLSSSGSIAISNDGGSASGHTNRFALTNFTSTSSDDNTALLGAAKGFTLAYSRTYLRPAFASSSTATYLRITYTVTWTGNTGRSYSRSSEAYFGKNGLRLSYQKS